MQDPTGGKSEQWERLAAVVLPVLLVIQAVLLWHHQGTVAGAADSSGYLNSAWRLARGEYSLPIQFIEGVEAEGLPDYVEEVYAPLGYRAARRNGTISPVYPVGLPLLLAGVATTTGWEAAAGCTIVLHALLALLLVYKLGREFGLPRGWSLLGSLLLGVSPLFLHMAVLTMSDVPALTWTTACLLAALRAKRHPGWATAAGLALGIAVLVRPTNILVIIPAIIALGWKPGHLLLFITGGIPAALVLVAYNLKTYGQILVSGYFNPPGSFAPHHVAPTLAHYAVWLPILLTPLVVAALALPWARGVRRREKLILGTWIAAQLGFYAVYVYTREDYWFLRFLLPAFPALTIACLLVLRGLAGRTRGRISRRVPAAVAWVAVALMVVVHGSLWTRSLRSFRTAEDELNYRTTALWAQNHLPADSVVFAMQDSGALFYYTELQLLRPDWLSPGEFRYFAQAIHKEERPIYAILKFYEEAKMFMRHLPGNWILEARVGDSSMWRLRKPTWNNSSANEQQSAGVSARAVQSDAQEKDWFESPSCWMGLHRGDLVSVNNNEA